MAKLGKNEWFLLEWLSKEDSSAYGECNGPALDKLVDEGIAELGPVPARGADYRRVWLTDYGWEVLTDARDATAEAAEVVTASWQ